MHDQICLRPALLGFDLCNQARRQMENSCFSSGRQAIEEGRKMNERSPQQLLTLIEVADLLRVSQHTIRAWVRKGRLRPVRLCRRLLFTPDEMARFISEAK